MMNQPKPKEGDLAVKWYPQIPCKPFVVQVRTVDEGARLLAILGDYDAFQFKHRIKGDYANAGALVVFEDGEWCEYSDPETGEGVNDVPSLARSSEEWTA